MSYSSNADHQKLSGNVEWDYFVSVADFGGDYLPIVFAIRTVDSDARSQIYSVATKENPGSFHGAGTQNETANGHPNYEESLSPDRIISDMDDGVKHSDRDSSGNELTEAQQEYFSNSKIRDKDGNLMVMYRGGREDFTVFDRKKSNPANLYGRGFYFTNSEAHARQYGNAKPFYLNITNPLMQGQKNITRQQMQNFIQAVADNEDDYGLDNYGYGATVSSVLKSVWGKGNSVSHRVTFGDSHATLRTGSE